MNSCRPILGNFYPVIENEVSKLQLISLMFKTIDILKIEQKALVLLLIK